MGRLSPLSPSEQQFVRKRSAKASIEIVVDLAAGTAVVAGAVATGRDAAKVAAAVGDHEDCRQSNSTSPVHRMRRRRSMPRSRSLAESMFWPTTRATSAGFFEELETRTSPQSTRHAAVRPDERHSRRPASDASAALRPAAHHLLDPGIAGQMFCTAYAAAKFGIEGWMESLAPEIAPLESARC